MSRRTTAAWRSCEKWDETSLASQRFVLGRVDGVELDARTEDGGELTVFTPYGDGLEQARFVLMSPKHPDVERWAAGAGVQEQLEKMRLGGWERSSRAAETIALVDTGRALTLPGDERSLPLLISPVVDERFGATAVLGVPALDRTDALIAQRIPGIETDAAIDGAGHPGEEAQAGEELAGGAAASATAVVEAAEPARPRARSRARARPFAIARTTSRSRASARGARRSRSCTASTAGRCRSRASSCRCCCRWT